MTRKTGLSGRDPDRPTVSLGTGDLESQVSDGKAQAREYFIARVVALYPAVLEEIVNRLRGQSPLDRSFRGAWKRRYRLTDRWIRSQVEYAAYLEATKPALSAQVRAGEMPLVRRGLSNLHPPRLPLADPIELTRSEYARLVERIALEHYDSVACLLRKDGHRPTRRRPRLHFDWLAHYVVGELGYAKIGRLESSQKANPDTVRKGVLSLATFIELTLPPPQSKKKTNRETYPSRIHP